MALAVRLAQEKLGLPAATIHLQPGILHSNHETPVYPGFETPRWWPLWFKRAFFDLVYALEIDPHIAPGLNAFRAELGLPPVRDVMRSWIHSPRLVLGSFPAWFGPPQPDWPAGMKLVGFPLYDERDATPLPADLETFLASGSPPVAFTPGSANVHARPFFEAAIEACARLGRRGLLLTRHPEQIPEGLPDGVRHVAYAPFGLLLPRVAALVHHGGIGTSAQGMAAGVPQLVMPLGYDQYDNAARMRRLGVARTLLPRRFRGMAVAKALRELLSSDEKWPSTALRRPPFAMIRRRPATNGIGVRSDRGARRGRTNHHLMSPWLRELRQVVCEDHTGRELRWAGSWVGSRAVPARPGVRPTTAGSAFTAS